jgi:hypothetical protein
LVDAALEENAEQLEDRQQYQIEVAANTSFWNQYADQHSTQANLFTQTQMSNESATDLTKLIL